MVDPIQRKHCCISMRTTLSFKPELNQVNQRFNNSYTFKNKYFHKMWANYAFSKKKWRETNGNSWAQITSDSPQMWQPVQSSRGRHTTAKAPVEEPSNPEEWLEDFASLLLPCLLKGPEKRYFIILLQAVLLRWHISQKKSILTLRLQQASDCGYWRKPERWISAYCDILKGRLCLAVRFKEHCRNWS